MPREFSISKMRPTGGTRYPKDDPRSKERGVFDSFTPYPDREKPAPSSGGVFDSLTPYPDRKAVDPQRPLSAEHMQVPTGAEDELMQQPPEATISAPKPFSISKMAPAPEDMTFAGMDVPDVAKPVLQPVLDFSRGANEYIATGLGLPAEGLDKVLKYLGTSGFLDNPGDGIKAVQDAMKAVGVEADSTEAVSEVASDIGKEAFQQAILVGAMFAAAPTMAAATGGSVLSTLGREIGNFMVKRPGATLAGEVGAFAGAETAGRSVEEGSKLAPLAELAGAAIGGGMGMGMVNMARVGAQRMLPTRGGKLVNEAVPDTPLVSGTPEYSNIQKAIEGDQIKIENLIERTISRIPTTDDPLRDAERLRKGLRTIYPKVRMQESKYWNAANTARKVPTADVKAFVKQMVKATSRETRPDFLPTDLIARINKLPKTVTIKRLNDLRSLILNRLRDNVVPSSLTGTIKIPDAMRRNMGAIQAEMLDTITRTYPGDRPLEQARAFSTWVHDRFTRGPVGQFARPRQGQEALPDAGRAADDFMRSERSGAQTADVAGTMNSQGIIDRASTFVQTKFREIAESMGPEGGLKWLNKPENKRFIKEFPAVAAKLETAGSRLRTLLDEKKTIEGSAFMRQAGEGPQVAIKRLFSAGDKGKSARELVKRLRFDKDAMRALKDGVINELMVITQTPDGKTTLRSPQQIANLMNSKDVRGMLQTTLGSNDFARLEKMISTAQQVAAGGEGFASRMGRAGGVKVANLFGALVGRWMNTGTLQAPSIGAQTAGNLVSNMLRTYPPEVLLGRAVLDPQWERLLYSRIPSNMEEFKRVASQVNTMTNMAEISRRAINDELESDDENAE